MNKLMDDISLREIELLIKEGATVKWPVEDGKPYLIVPTTHEVRDMEEYLPWPKAKRGILTFTRLESFETYVNNHKDDSTLVLFDGQKFSAVLDHHFQDHAGWKKHVAIYAPTHTPNWLTWTSKNKIGFSQSDFAEFLDDNRGDVLMPIAGELLDMVRELEAVRDVTFKGALKNDNSTQRIEFEENTTTRTKGNIELPSEIILGIAVYQGSGAQEFPCRLKAQLHCGSLLLTYEIRNLAARLQESTDRLVEDVKDAIDIEPLFGSER
jgi:uncharacterized protein YfdQ (DUF2303 family)